MTTSPLPPDYKRDTIDHILTELMQLHDSREIMRLLNDSEVDEIYDGIEKRLDQELDVILRRNYNPYNN